MHDQVQHELGYKDHYNKKNSLVRLSEANRDYPVVKNKFKISQNLPSFGTQAHPQLDNLKALLQITIQNKLAAVQAILQTKILTKLDSCFHSIKDARDPHLQGYSRRKMMEGVVGLFMEKLGHVWQEQKLKRTFYFMGNLKLLFGKGRNQNSKRQMLRINSKVDQEQQELDFIDRNYSNQATSNSQKTYKQLKKKKEAADKEFSNFKQQFQQLLSHHEAYLSKKH